MVSQAFLAASDLELLSAVSLFLGLGISGSEGASFASSQTGIGFPSLKNTGLTWTPAFAIPSKIGFKGPAENFGVGDLKDYAENREVAVLEQRSVR